MVRIECPSIAALKVLHCKGVDIQNIIDMESFSDLSTISINAKPATSEVSGAFRFSFYFSKHDQTGKLAFLFLQNACDDDRIHRKFL